MKEFWDERYSAEEYIYGKEPSAYFRQILDRLEPGRILIPGAGEGRDAVYAARRGWEVHAFDQSKEGKNKAMKLARQFNVTLSFDATDAAHYKPGPHNFDLIALVFFHLPMESRKSFHQKLIKFLNPGGYIVLEAFHQRQLGNSSGGPKDLSLLMTGEMLKDDFADLTIIENNETVVELNEGSHHHGRAELVRFLGQNSVIG